MADNNKDVVDTSSEDYENWTWKQIMNAIVGGFGEDLENPESVSNPSSIYSSADTFTAVSQSLTSTKQQMSDWANALFGGDSPRYSGEAAESLNGLLQNFVGNIDDHNEPLQFYSTSLYDAGNSLTWAINTLHTIDYMTAKAVVDKYYQDVKHYNETHQDLGILNDPPDPNDYVYTDGNGKSIARVSKFPWAVDYLNTHMRDVIKTLAKQYQTTRGDLHAPPSGGFGGNGGSSTNMPNLEYPNLNYPNLNYPNLNYPNLNYPNLNYPNLNYPNIKSPNLGNQNLKPPNLNYVPSSLGSPNLKTPNLNYPNSPGINNLNYPKSSNLQTPAYHVGKNGELLDANGNPVLGPDGKPLKVGRNGQILQSNGKPLLGADGKPLHLGKNGQLLDSKGNPAQLPYNKLATPLLNVPASPTLPTLRNNTTVPGLQTPAYHVGKNGELLDANGNPVLGPDGKPLKVGRNGQILQSNGKPLLGADGKPLHLGKNGQIQDSNGNPVTMPSLNVPNLQQPKYQVGKNGKVLDSNGKPILGPNGKPLTIDKNGNLLDSNGKPLPPLNPLSPLNPLTKTAGLAGGLRTPDIGSGGPGLGSLLGSGLGAPGSRSPKLPFSLDSLRSGEAPVANALAAEQQALARQAAAAGNGRSGTGGYPYGMGGMGGHGSGAGKNNNEEQERTTWLVEEEDVWGTDPDDVGPSFLDNGMIS